MIANFNDIQKIVGEYIGRNTDETYYEASSHIDRIEQRGLPVFAAQFARLVGKGDRVLEVGCGHGLNLLNHAGLFREGIGMDDSENMLRLARENGLRTGADNVRFHWGKAASMPFDDDSFDMIASERGPLGFSAVTLKEAVRVAKNGAVILIETMGEMNGAFGKGGSFLTNLELNGRLFREHSIDIHFMATTVKKLIFADYEGWLRYQCCSYNDPPSEEMARMTEEEFIHRFGPWSGGTGRELIHHTIVLMGIIGK